VGPVGYAGEKISGAFFGLMANEGIFIGREVRLMNEETVFPEIIEQPVMWGPDRDLHSAARYKALVDADTGKLFSIVSQDYRVIRHEKAIEQVEEAISENPDFGAYEIATDFYNDGGRLRRKYVFPDISVEIRQGDKVNLELQLLNSYDVTWPFTVLLGAFRLVCSNGLVIGKKFLHFRKRHIQDLGQIGLKDQVSTALNRFEMQTQQWKEWTNRTLTANVHTQIMNAMQLGNKAGEDIEHRIFQEAGDCDDNGFPIISLWAFFNILTWHITHRAVSLNHRVVLEKRLRAAMEASKN
jgi:hypothetical protein